MVDYSTHTCKNKYKHDLVVRKGDWKLGCFRDRIDVAEFGKYSRISGDDVKRDMRNLPPIHASVEVVKRLKG